MNPKKFSLDIIVVRSDIPSMDEASLDWDIVLNDETKRLQPDRVNVVEFPKSTLFEVQISPSSFCEILHTGLGVYAYRGEEQLGVGKCVLPKFILNQLYDPTCILAHIVECELFHRNDSIGIVELNIRIQSIHPDHDRRYYEMGPYEICRPQDGSVNPRDMIFVMGRSTNTPTHSAITDKRLISSAMREFQSGGTEKNVSDKNPWWQTTDPCSCTNIPKIQKSKSNVPQKQHYCTCSALGSSTSSSQMNDDNECTQWQMDDGDARADQKFLLGTCPRLAPPLLTQNTFKTPRYCLLCKEDISWLPKITACPYCGYKFVPDVEEKPYNDRLTAAELIDSYVKDKKNDENADCELLPHNEECITDMITTGRKCGCTKGRPCSRCRIKKLCETIYKDQIKITSNKVPGMPPTKDASDGTDNNAKLLNIFTEMRNVYDKKFKEENKIVDVEEQMNEACNEYCSKKKSKSKAKSNSNSKSKSKKSNKKKSKCEKELRKEFGNIPKLKKSPKLRPKFKSKTYSKLSMREIVEKPLRHQNCVSDSAFGRHNKVPSHVGWLWRLDKRAQNHKWKPGYIPRSVREIMAYFLKDFPADTLCVSRYGRHFNRQRKDKNEESKPLVQHPTLYIEKHNDEYTITFRALKDINEMSHSPDPYIDMKPIKFKIVKSPILAEKRQMKQSLKQMGFQKCKCGQPVADCFCRSHIDKLLLLDEMNRQRKQTGSRFDFTTTLVLSDTSDSEAEYEFGVTPPAGVIKPERGPKPDAVNTETQYDVRDWYMPNLFSTDLGWSPLVRYFPCATAERPKQKQSNDKKAKKKKKAKKNKMPSKVAFANKSSGEKRLKGGRDEILSSDGSYEERILQHFKGLTHSQRTRAAYLNRNSRVYFNTPGVQISSTDRF